MAQIEGHAGKSADLEQELSGVKEQLVAAEAKLESETASVKAELATALEKIEHTHAEKEESEAKYATAAAEIE